MIKWNNYIQDESIHHFSDITVDPTFRKLSKNSICFHIWKVEDNRIESIPKSQYGIFYDDSTYIIYAASTPGNAVNQDTITRELKNPPNIERYIHFWLGNKTTPQKSGNVAYKIMELDTYFGNITTQFREAQENESSRFLSYFKKGIRILCGSLRTSGKDYKLFQIRGKKSPKCIEQETISWDNFSSAYLMILKSSTSLFVWIGRSSSLSERRNGLTIANKLKEEYELLDLIIVDDGYEQSMNELHKYEWNRCLSLKNRYVHEPPLIDQKPEFSLKLYKCGYHGGKYRIEEYKTEPPEQSDLSDEEATYIIDGASLGVWMWIGKSVNQMEKTEAMRNARGFVKKKKYPSSTPVIRVIQDNEPVEFCRLFTTWITTENSQRTKTLSKLDSVTLYQRPKLAADTQLVDDGSGEKHIFRITDGRYNELINQKHLVFFSSDCYLVHYITVGTKFADLNSSSYVGVKLIVYFWIGSSVSSDTKKKCEASAKNYFENLDEHTMIVRLNQGFETPHFLQIFSGKFIVLNGQNDAPVYSDITSKIPKNFILKIYGDSTYTSKAFEVNSVSVRSSQDRFIIKSNSIWIWCGQGSTGDAREVAKSIGSVFGEYILVMESKEPEEFLKLVPIEFKQSQLNGHSMKEANKVELFDRLRASLYVSFQVLGNFYTQEIFFFDQSDLAPEDIYFLDIGSVIFMWVGSLSIKDERKTCWQAVKQFIQNYSTPRDENITVTLIQQNGEPNIFTGFFDSWNKKFWKDHVTYDELRKSIQKIVPNNHTALAEINGENDFDKYQKYPLSVLQQEADHLPQGVDPIRKEIHLTHDDFVSIFGIKFSEFDHLPIWRKQELKKKHKLF